MYILNNMLLYELGSSANCRNELSTSNKGVACVLGAENFMSLTTDPKLYQSIMNMETLLRFSQSKKKSETLSSLAV